MAERLLEVVLMNHGQVGLYEMMRLPVLTMPLLLLLLLLLLL